MSNLWESLDPEQQNALVKAHVAGNGGATPENINRAKEQLSQNPTLVERLAKETGVTSEDDTLQDGEDAAEEMTAETVAEESLVDEGAPEVAGSLPKTLPPPEEGEDVQAYYDRIMAAQESGGVYDKVTPPKVRGSDGTIPYEDEEPDEFMRREIAFDMDQQRRANVRSPSSVVRRSNQRY